jgi:hypothetical protein
VQERNSDGESALMYAAKSGHMPAVDFWLTYQGINQKNHDLTTYDEMVFFIC